MDRQLWQATAREVVALLRKREVTPLDLVDAAAARIEAVEDKVNALPTLCLERAREQARRLMEAGAPSEPDPGCLYGLPIAVKDLTAVAGVRTTMGSPIYADHVPEASDVLVERLEASQAIVVAKSNTPEFGAGANTFNEVFGETVNPWDTRTTCGGSSGGSAAALATGEVWLATGSDLGGSLRIPASFCSVVGLRPSPGRVAHGSKPLPHGPAALPFEGLSVHGPMARNVGDLALMLDAMCGEHPEDPLSLPAPALPFQRAVEAPAAPRRVAWSPDLGLLPVDREVREITAKAAQWFAETGAEVVEASIDLSDARDIFQTLRAAMMAHRHGPMLAERRDALKPDLIWNIEKGQKLTVEEIGRAERGRAALYQRTVDFFQDHDLLLCPAVAVPPFDVRQRYVTEIEGIKFDNYVDWLMLTFVLTLTACPALSLPCGFTSAGLPVGLQMLGRPRGEAALLGAARLFEAAHDFAGLVPMDPRVAGDR